jgi:hypothetical protein
MAELTAVASGARERQIAVSPTTGYWYISALDFADPGHGHGAYNVLWTSKDGGLSWARQVLGNSANNQMLALGGSKLYLIWEQTMPNLSKHSGLTCSLDDGQTWAAPIDLSGPTGYPNPEGDEVHLPEVSLWNDILSVSYVSQGSMWVRSTADIT